MAFDLYIADLTDASAATRLVDFNSYDSGTGHFLVDPDSFSLGGTEFEEVWLSEEGVDDDVLAAARRPHARMDFDLHYIPRDSSDTPAALQSEIRALNQALNAPGLIVTAPPGYDTLYIDYLRSPLTTPFIPGQARLRQLFSLLASPSGLHLSINRRAKMRGAQLLAAINKVHNGTLAEDHDGDGIPSLWAWDSGTGLSAHGFSWTYGAYRFTHSAASTRVFQQVVTPAAEAQTWTLWFEAAATGATVTLKAELEFLDSGNALLGSAQLGTAPTLTAPSAGFERVQVTATAPANTAKVRVSVSSAKAAATPSTIYVRKVQAEQASSPTAWRPGVETVSNDVRDPFFKRIWVWAEGNIDGLAKVTATPEVGANTVQLRFARRSGFRNSQAAMQVFGGIRGISATALGGSTTVSDTAATGDQALQSSVGGVYEAIVRVEAPQTDETSLRGKWNLRAAMRFPVDWIGDVQGRYGLGDVTDLPRPMRNWPIDMSDPTTSQYVEVDFGIADVPAGSDGLFFEIWARRTGGSGSPLVDVIWPMPADDQTATTHIPGHDDPGTVQTEKWLPEDFTSPPDDPAGLNAGTLLASGDFLLNDMDEAFGVPEDATAALTPGVLHTFTVKGTMYNPGLARLAHGQVRVRDLNTSSTIVEAPIIAPKGSKWPTYTASVKFTPTTGHAYSIYVQQTIAGTDGNIHATEVSHSFIPPVVGGTSIVLDGPLRQPYVLESDLRASDLAQDPPFPSVEPGLQLWRLATAENPATGYDTVTSQDLNKHDPDITFDVAVDIVPRWTN